MPMSKGGGRRPSIPVGLKFAEDPDLDTTKIGLKEVKAVYRMNYPRHSGASGCKKNCKNNPRCLTGLGEKVWLEVKDEDDENNEEEEDLMRSEGIPSGLRNLGNTCYVNSFLQIWFHNKEFRQALYDWEPGEDPEEQNNCSILDAELYEPASKVASLQALFSMIQFTKRKFVDPADFIGKLGLNPTVQQDAQEFSKLFINLLENSLANQSSSSVRTMVQRQFRGDYVYVTTCQKCLNESLRPTHFYELDLHITGNKTIEACLQDFTKVETMTGDEKYYCEKCCSKQDATRCCKLTELPPVLNLQLNRFQYDLQLGRKKKLNSAIQFPEELDMAQFYTGSSPTKYCLTGVLMHVGPDPNHGHYIAHIQDMESGNWFKFSDECVVHLQGKHLSLGVEEEIIGPGRKGKVGKKENIVKTGFQKSNNAYMLVYMQQEKLKEIRAKEIKEKLKRDAVLKAGVRGELSKSTEYDFSDGKVFPVNFPSHLRIKIEKDNQEFEANMLEKFNTKILEKREAQNQQDKMQSDYLDLEYDSDSEAGSDQDESFEFLPLVWIQSWLANPSLCGPIDTQHVLCVHDNLDIDKLHNVKLCSRETVSRLYLEYGAGDGPRLTSERLCQMCVTNRARLTSLDFKMMRDMQFLIKESTPENGTGFWVGRKSYARWKTLAKVALEDKIVEEVNEWKANRSSQERRKRKFEEVGPSPSCQSKGEFCLSELKAKLLKMGTNVSIAPKGSVRNGPIPGATLISNGDHPGISKIPELAAPEEEKKVKPSCAVAPTMKSPKPSATVKPFIKTEGLVDLPSTISPTSPTKSPSPKLDVDETSKVIPSEKPVQSSNSACCSESRSSSRSSSLDSDPSDPSNLTSGSSEVSSRETSGGETDTVSPVPAYQPPGEDDFNADIVCHHGNMRIEERSRQIISREAWAKLSSYFYKPTITFQFGVKPCYICEEEQNHAVIQREKWREEAARQKSRLPELFKDTDRPRWSKPSTTRVFLLSSSFVLAWRGFVRGLSAGKAEAVGENITHVNNKSLLCPHLGFIYLPTLSWETEPNPNLVMITESEWATVQDMFTVDIEIRVDRENCANGPVLTSNPLPCHICVASRQEAEQEDLLIYNNKRVFVRRISPDEKIPEDTSHDPEYCDNPIFGGNKAAMLLGGNVRRSSRRVKPRGEREFLVNSDMLLRDLKVMIMETFKVAPYDQNLMVNGEYLTENHLTLGQLKVLPSSLIFLRADEPANCAQSPSEDYVGQNHPETGFKGTGLLSG